MINKHYKTMQTIKQRYNLSLRPSEAILWRTMMKIDELQWHSSDGRFVQNAEHIRGHLQGAVELIHS